MQLRVRNIFKMQVQSFYPQELYYINSHVCLPQFLLQPWPRVFQGCLWKTLCGKFGEHERCVRVAQGIAESNSSFLSALQTSQVLLILMNPQLMYESIIL